MPSPVTGPLHLHLPPPPPLTTQTLLSLLPPSPPESGSPSQLSEWNKLLPRSSFFQASLGDTKSTSRKSLVMWTALGSTAQSIDQSGNIAALNCSSYLFTVPE